MKKLKVFFSKISISSLIAFVVSWISLSLLFPFNSFYYPIAISFISLIIAIIVNKIRMKSKHIKNNKLTNNIQNSIENYEISDNTNLILSESENALKEMANIYSNVKDPEMKTKINDLMKITDKITQDAVNDPNDIPKIKRFFNYYLPTTIKMLNMYDRMAYQDIDGDNINQTMCNIQEVLDSAIASYKKMLDSLFNDQALDIETDIQVMNSLLRRDGLSQE